MTTIIAEIGSVHDGSFGNALALIDLACEVGANAVKFQTHIAPAETIRNAPNPPYFRGEPRFEYFERTAFSLSQWKVLRQHAKNKGIKFGSSPFSPEAVNILEQIAVDFLKIPSGEVTNEILLKRCLESKIPIYLSSGMSDWKELDDAIKIISKGTGELVVMQCSSAYPCPNEIVGLNVLTEMKNRWQLPVGFSDHTDGIAAPIAAVALGAVVIEKHLTFSRKMYGSDASLAATPELFSQMAEAVRAVNVMMDNPVDKNDLTNYQDMKKTFEKSIVANQNLKKGTILDRSMIAMKKPGTGLSSKFIDRIIGLKLIKDVKQDHLFSISDFQ